jgi:electron transport complex protein RnfB
MNDAPNQDVRQDGGMNRREALRWLARGLALAAVAALAGRAVRRGVGRRVWQIDPRLCVQCGRCATACVLRPSAVKCVHGYALCGYCKRCFGFFQPDARDLNEAAENQLCPTNAIERAFVEDPYFEYKINEGRCIGCGICVKGCDRFGNGSLFLQIRHDRCLQCHECAIARGCPAGAIRQVPAATPYMLKDAERNPAPANRPAHFHV